MALEEIRNERIKKLEKLGQEGLDPYPAKTSRAHLVSEVLKKFSLYEKSKRKVSVAGRITAKREHGGSTFLDLRDGSGPPILGEPRSAELSGQIQVYFKKDTLDQNLETKPPSVYDFALEVIDIGDFLEVEGRLFKTKKGEATIEVNRWKMLAKSLHPLPEKWHGLQDTEERFRKRYLDLLMNEEVGRRFQNRSLVISAIRAFFDHEGFLEVETPMLHSIPGGAMAKPFKTHHNALGLDLYLRIAPELYLKELLVGGLDKVYELGKSFRNEGIDHSHNPEFTTIEWYAAYWDEEDMMKCVENCLKFILKKFKLKDEVVFDGKKIKFDKKFKRISFKEVLKRYALVVDYDGETRDSLALRAKQLGIEIGAKESKGKIADEIYKKVCRPHLIEPTFVFGHPLDISPLAKISDKGGDETRRFQLIVGGMEIVNAFSELNDPQEQRKRLEEQEKRGMGGEEETHPIDEGFIEALEYGMPPAAGAGMGIDRLVMLLTDTRNIKEVILFPTMRPKS